MKKKISMAKLRMRGFLANRGHEKGMQVVKCTVFKEIQVVLFGSNVKKYRAV